MTHWDESLCIRYVFRLGLSCHNSCLLCQYQMLKWSQSLRVKRCVSAWRKIYVDEGKFCGFFLRVKCLRRSISSHKDHDKHQGLRLAKKIILFVDRGKKRRFSLFFFYAFFGYPDDDSQYIYYWMEQIIRPAMNRKATCFAFEKNTTSCNVSTDWWGMFFSRVSVLLCLFFCELWLLITRRKQRGMGKRGETFDVNFDNNELNIFVHFLARGDVRKTRFVLFACMTHKNDKINYCSPPPIVLDARGRRGKKRLENP